MSSYRRLIYNLNGLDFRICESRDPYRVRVFKTEELSSSYYTYATCFFDSAHQLASYLLETEAPSISELDSFFFPLAFLYRHSIELLLKATGFQYILDKSERISFITESFHNLFDLFQVIKNKSRFRRLPDEVEWLDSYFNSLSLMDKESDSFRYPFHIISEEDLGGKSYRIERVFNKQTDIDLIKFVNKFEACYEILNKWYNHDTQESLEWCNLSPVFIDIGGDYYYKSVVGYTYVREDYYPYVQAYTEAAGYLRDYMKNLFQLKSYNRAGDFFLPMCYLYRNCVELAQKSIWFEEIGENLHVRCEILRDNKHSLVGMWKYIEPYISDCGTGSEEDIQYISFLQKMTFELHSYDSDASHFRYPTDKNLEPYFHDNKWFDFFRVADFFEGLICGYTGIASTMHERNQALADMVLEMDNFYS